MSYVALSHLSARARDFRSASVSGLVRLESIRHALFNWSAYINNKKKNTVIDHEAPYFKIITR